MTLVRRARAEDADAVFELVRQLGAAFVPVRSIFDETFAEIVGGDDQHVQVIVAEDDQGVVRGYALTTIARLLSTNGPSAQLQEIAVDEEARGLALGTALVREVEAECIRRGVRQLTVAARRAGGFYDRLGYSQNAEHMRRVF
ncbi:GNAT family N-acetyltransferase [Microcella frigidaquae]|uniref:Ribosomal protein S18 acetylase RimI-like enzyme n=1 Tax=Microcella frigidaquae TaxID=424758 RepID=A0A840XLP4_9MICO|nr:GNAT family N-acetyltransferase [Microcella frigidaquae]MBB5616819.1 ribosomal protein S18 acetylase RimI-like enzyme [Microcella frigidaquae]NHN43742.1 GNAT family N-acetyltransferase [Microcella frigidaquae]